MKRLNSVIYNNLIKVFNDAANSKEIKEYPKLRDHIIELRKKFPTYNELLALDLWYIDKPWVGGLNNKLIAKTWVGKFDGGVVDCDIDADIRDASIVHTIGFVRGANPKTMEPLVALKIRGLPKLEYMEKTNTGTNQEAHDEQVYLLKKVLNQ
ncbi:hypothetical protein Acj9p014 [Acinetobacter phage Acj9]|uniref:Uncharacterized protein n=1 Tax=Acinetobacter phage Acj9 TaxID=760939 RepID=E5EPE8_9CAUD|nr:hypothetical protein Acj9p014 [Acinetobacter phage Acj9]ADG59914.1 hypothetical protein Acj9p014 [Acinetobacter phage Acj9]